MSKHALALAALLALTPALAGCLQPEGLELTSLSSIVDPPVDGTLTFRDVLAHDGNATLRESPLGADETPVAIEQMLPSGGAEPNVGITSSGATFVTVGDLTYRSRDLGATWEVVHEFTSPNFPTTYDVFRSADPMLWVDKDTDRVYVSHMHPAIQCTFLAWTDDEGESWTERYYYCGIPGIDHQKVMTARPRPTPLGVPPPMAGYPNVLYVCVNKRLGISLGENGFGTTCQVSLDGGLTVAYESPVYANNVDCGNINGHPAPFPDGTVAVILGAFGDGCPRPMTVAVSEDNGLTWDLRECDPELGQYEIDADITVTPDGTAYALVRDADQLVHMVRSTDKFLTCDHFRVSPADHTVAVFAGITSGDDGRVAMAYLATRDPVEPGSIPSNVTPGTVWHAFVTTSFDAASESPTFLTQQVTPEEDPVQVGCIWLSGGAGGPYGCRNLLDFIDMTVDPDGRFVAAITDGCSPRNGCTGSPEQSDFQSRDRQVAVLVQDRGMSLLADKGVLPSLGLVPPTPYER